MSAHHQTWRGPTCIFCNRRTSVFEFKIKGTLQAWARSSLDIGLPLNQSAKPSILTLQELKQLFPRDRASLRDLWGDPRERAHRESQRT
jgi:hypothetical protein